MITVLIPTTPDRRTRLQECLTAIWENTTDIEYRVVIFENEIGWTKAIHKALEGIDGYVVVIGSDVIVKTGWLRTLNNKFFEAFPEGDGVASPYDEFHNGKLITHPFAHSKTLLKYISTEYFHCFSDNELTDRAIADGKYIYVPEAKIDHRHVLNHKADIDDTYRKIYQETINKDQETYIRRKNRQGIVITTCEATKPFFLDLMESLKDVKYPIVVVGNSGYKEEGIDIVNDWNAFELGGILHGAKLFNEFVYLQDTVVIKDISLFDKCFKDNKGQSVAISQDFYSYIGKYITSQCGEIPKTDNKRDAVFHELSGFRPQYVNRAKPVNLDEILPHTSDRFEERHGRKNMVLENKYMIKYKGTWSEEQI